MWQYNETATFVKSADELGLSQIVRDALKSWAVSVGRVQTNKTKHFFRSPRNVFEIWTARVPDPDRNKGASGGFRLVYFFLIAESAIYLDRIEHRSDLGGRSEHPKSQREFTTYLNDLKSYLIKEFDSEADAK